MVIRLLKPNACVVHADHTEHLRGKLIDIRLIGDGDACPFDTLWVRVTPMIGCMHGANAVCGIIGAGFTGVNRCILFLVDSSISKRTKVSYG